LENKMVNWLKSRKGMRMTVLSAIMALVLVITAMPVFADWSDDYLDVTGTYLVTSAAAPKELDNSRHPKVQFNRLIITTQSYKAITDATLEHMGTDIDLDGIVGPGLKPIIHLYGTDSDGAYIHLQGRVISNRAGEVSGIRGRISGLITSDGSRWDDSADGTAEISTADYHSEPLSCLITGGTDANPKTLLFHQPYSRVQLRHLSNLKENQLGFWFNLETDKGPGPQMMLRFTPRVRNEVSNQSYWGGAGTAYVDISVMPYQSPYVGTGSWVECDLASDDATIIYYGNDPTDYTSFGGTPVSGIADVEAAINAEAAMTADGDSASTWILSMVSVELWEAGARNCYVDDVTIGGHVYNLEPNSYYSGFKAIVVP